MNTPPQTPMSTSGGGGTHSAANSISGSTLGKRDAGMASESEKEDSGSKDDKTIHKKRRIAPTLVSGGVNGEGGQPPPPPPPTA